MNENFDPSRSATSEPVFNRTRRGHQTRTKGQSARALGQATSARTFQHACIRRGSRAEGQRSSDQVMARSLVMPSGQQRRARGAGARERKENRGATRSSKHKTQKLKNLNTPAGNDFVYMFLLGAGCRWQCGGVVPQRSVFSKQQRSGGQRQRARPGRWPPVKKDSQERPGRCRRSHQEVAAASRSCRGRRR